MSTMNRIGNSGNRYQGAYKRVLCVCSAGLLRSPTAALVLSQAPFNYNTRSVGVSTEYAMIPLDVVHLHWADEVVTMQEEHTMVVERFIRDAGLGMNAPKIIQLDIPDNFEYRNPVLIDMIVERYNAHVA